MTIPMTIDRSADNESGSPEGEIGFDRAEKKGLTMTLKKNGCLCFISCVLWLTLLSCASSPPKREIPPGAAASVKGVEPSPQVRAMNEKLLMSVLSAKRTSSKDYRIGPDDLIEVNVFEDEKLNKTVRVSSQGNVSLPLIGILRVKGLTGSEMEKEIRDLLADKYLQDPHVSIFIKEYHNQRVSMMGAVTKPGVYDVTGEKTVLDLLSLAGGIRDDAGKMLFLIRPPSMNGDENKKGKEPEAEAAKTLTAGLEELLIKGDLSLNFTLEHGDVINIPPAGKVFVGGLVQSPGGFAMSKSMTLSQAIAVAGGLSVKADASETRIFRYAGRGDQKEVLTFNAYAIQKGQTSDPYLQENDVIFVPRSGTKTVLIEIWEFMKGPLSAFSVWE
jgi:polysaccharide export outer membrane protein